MTYFTPQKNAIYYIWRLVGYTFIGMVCSQVLSYLLLKVLYPEGDFVSMLDVADKDAHQWHTVRVLQVIYQVCTFLVPALFVWKSFSNNWNVFSSTEERSGFLPFLIAPVLLFTFFPLVQQFYIINQNFHFPEPLDGILRTMEEQNNQLIQGMLGSTSAIDILSNFLLIAVLAAIIEEIFFRGVLQRILSQYIDPHIAIFIAAVAFSAIHMQFLGFLPRLALGILFGYLYWRTNRLSLAIFVHFLFNGLQLLTFYALPESVKQKNIDEPIEFSILFTLASTLLFFILYYIFHKILTKKTKEEHGIK